MPNARFLSFSGLDHVEPQRLPALVVPHIDAFLAEVEQLRESGSSL